MLGSEPAMPTQKQGILGPPVVSGGNEHGLPGEQQGNSYLNTAMDEGEGAPATPPQSGSEGPLRPKMSRSQARRHRRDILRQVKNNPEGAEEYIKQKQQKMLEVWQRQQQEGLGARQEQGAKSSFDSRQHAYQRSSGQRGGLNSRDVTCTENGMSSDSGSHPQYKRVSVQQLPDDQTHARHTFARQAPYMTPSRISPSDVPLGRSLQRRGQKLDRMGSAGSLYSLEDLQRLQAEKEAAEASTDMITKEFEKLLEDKQKISAEKQSLEARYRRLQERLEYLECVAGHDVDHGEDCDNEQGHVQEQGLEVDEELDGQDLKHSFSSTQGASNKSTVVY